MSFKNFIFDFDGTMLNSGVFSFEFIKRHVKTSLSMEDMRRKTTREALQIAGINQLRLMYLMLKGRRELFRQHREITIEPGIPQLFADLVAMNTPIYIVSSNSKKNIRTILAANGLLPHIKDISSSIGVWGKGKKLLKLMKKHQLQPGDTIYIGDETRDIEAAHSSGIAAGAVAWGFNTIETLGRYNPDYAFFHPAEIAALAFDRARD